MADVDYDELVEGTIDEVKEAVEEQGLDPHKVLAAERRNKDRVTLREWLKERTEDTGTGTEASGGIVTAVTSTRFVAGLLVGLVVAGLVLSTGVVGSGGSAAQVSSSVETYFSDNAADIPLQGVRVQNAERLAGSDMYQLDMVLEAEFLNRTVEQNQTAIVTPDARYIFLSSPIDTQRPLSEQIGGTRQQGAPQG